MGQFSADIPIINKCLNFCSLNVCGIKKRICCPDFIEVVNRYDLFCVVETTIDITDLISVPGYSFTSQQKQQYFIRKSSGIGTCLRNNCLTKYVEICTDSGYILWL